MDCEINDLPDSEEAEDVETSRYEEIEDDPEDRELEPYQYASMKAPVYNGL